MRASAQDYAAAIYESVKDSPEQRRVLVERFLKKLREDGQSRLLPLILEELRRIEAEKGGRLLVTVTAAKPLTDPQRQEITDTLRTGRITAVELREQVDPTVIGGIKLQLGNRVIDHTVKTKLDQLAAKL